MSLSTILKRFLGQVPVTVNGLLTQDDISKLIDEFDHNRADCHDVIIISRNGDNKVRLGIAGRCVDDDLKTLGLLTSAICMIVDGNGK